MNFSIEARGNYEKIILWDKCQKVEVTKYILGERAFDEFVGVLVEMTNKTKVGDFTNGKQNRRRNVKYRRQGISKSEKLAILKRYAITAVKVFGVLVIFSFILFYGVLYSIDDENYILAICSIVMMILSVVIAIVKFRYKNKKELIRFIEKNKEIAFLHIEYSGFINSKRIEILKLDGCCGFEMLMDTGVKPRKVFLIKAGYYEAVVAYVINSLMFVGSEIVTHKDSQAIKFAMEADKYYELKYNVGLEEYSFREEAMPRSLDGIVNMIEMRD